VSYREGWRWAPVSESLPVRLADVAVSPANADRVAFVTVQGAVWLSADRGASWDEVLEVGRRSLGGGSTDEAVLIGAEARVEELQGDLGLEDLEVDPDDYIDDPEGLAAAQEAAIAAAEELADQAGAVTTDALDQVRGEIADGVFFEFGASISRDRGRAAIGVRPRVWFAPSGAVLVSRADGLRVSRDLGQSWSLVLDVPVSALVRLEGRDLWVAGTLDGMRYAVDLAQWIDAVDGTEGLRVWDLALDAGRVYAATSAGLWSSPDAQTWDPVGTLTDPYQGLLLPDTEGDPMLLATPRTIRRSPDLGQSLIPEPQAAPLPAVLSILRMGTRHVLIASADGPWESVDGGQSWSSLARGLTEPRTRGLAGTGEDVFLASEEGLFRLVPDASGSEQDEGDQGRAMGIQEWIALDALMGTAMSRPELTATIGSRAAAAALPEVTLEGVFAPEDRLLYSPLAGSERELDALWGAKITLRWTPSRPARDPAEPIALSGLGVDADLPPATVGHAVRRDAATYASNIAAMVADLYTGRAELVAGRRVVGQESLREKVRRELKILELEAQLDHITNGAVSAWRSQ